MVFARALPGAAARGRIRADLDRRPAADLRDGAARARHGGRLDPCVPAPQAVQPQGLTEGFSADGSRRASGSWRSPRSNRVVTVVARRRSVSPARLADRTVKGCPLLVGRADHRDPDDGAAPGAGLARPGVDVVGHPLTGVPGGALHRRGHTAQHQPASDVQHVSHLDLRRRRPRRDACDEKGFRHVHGADTGHSRLVEQPRADGPVRGLQQACDGFRTSGSGKGIGHHVRPEMTDQLVLGRGRDQIQHAEPGPDGRPVLVRQHRAHGHTGSPGPMLRTGRGDGPLAFHLEVRVQGEGLPAGPCLEPDQQVLSVGADLGDGGSGQIDVAQVGPAEFRT